MPTPTRCRVLTPLRCDGHRYAPGDEMDVPARHRALIERGIVEPLTDRLGVPATDGPILPRGAVEAKSTAGNPAGRGKARSPRRKPVESKT